MKTAPVALRGHNPRARRPATLEFLESRVYLSSVVEHGVFSAATGRSVAAIAHSVAVSGPNYDLVATLTSLPKFSGPIVTDMTITGTVNVKITNSGTDNSPAVASSVILYLRPAGGTGSTDINITSVAGTVSKVGAGKSANAKLSLTIPAVLPSGAAFSAGSYSLVVVVTGGNGGADAVSVIPILTLTDVPGAVNLSASITGGGLSPTIVAGSASKGGSISFVITNQGNIPTLLFSGVNIAVTLLAADGHTSIPLASMNNVALKTLKGVGGKTGAAKDTFKVVIPALTAIQTAAIPLGTYTFQVTVTPIASGAASLPPIVLTGPGVTFTTGPIVGGAIFKHGDTITFNCNFQQSGAGYVELGNFVTNTGATGGYQIFPSGLFLNYSTGDSDAVSLAFIGAQQFLDPTLDGVGRNVTFSFHSAGAFGTFPTVGFNSHTAYATFS